MNYIDIDLKSNSCSAEYVVGYQGESYVNGIRFILPDELISWSVFVDLENSNGDKTRYEIVDIDNNIATYEFTSIDLKYRGKLILNLILVKDKQILKPYVGEFIVKEAICAENESSENVPIILSSNLSKEIYKNISSRHEHINETVLNKLSESDDGNLIYNGNPIIGGSIQEETDPTVSDWAKQEEKPKYSADEISGFDEKSKKLIDSSLNEAKESGMFDDVYIGSGEMPEGYVLQIDPDGSATTIPTKTSQLENDSGYITNSDIPTKLGQLENDSGYITSDDLPADELPSVTESDNGKVLKVVNGVWAAEIPDASGVNTWDLITEVALDTETAKYILCSCDEYDRIEIMIKRDSNNTSLTGNMVFEIVDTNGNSVVELYSNNMPGYREKLTIMEVNGGYAHCIATTSNNLYASGSSLSRGYYVGEGCKYCLRIPKPDTACDGLSTMTVIGRRAKNANS